MLSNNKNPEYFMTVAKEGSISKAAKVLFISQPYLSQYIQKLEKDLDMQLLDRSKNPIEMTEAGRIYYEYLENCASLSSKLTYDLNNLNSQRKDTLDLGIAPWRGSTLLPDILPKYILHYPNVHIVLHEYPVKEIINLLEKNVVSLGIINSTNFDTTKFHSEFIMHENIVLVANKNNPLTSHLVEMSRDATRPVDLKILENECFILMKQGLACAEWVNNYLENIKICINQKIITTSKATAVNLVSQNLGFCFIPKSGCHWAAKSEDLVFIDLHSPDLITPLVALYKKSLRVSKIVRDFVDAAKEYYSKH